MKNNKFVLVFSAVLMMMSSLAFSGEKKVTSEHGTVKTNFNVIEATAPKTFNESTKITAPKNREIALVGKIIVKTTQNMDFYAETRGLNDQVKSHGDVYTMRGSSTLYDAGSFFYEKISKPKKSEASKFTIGFKYYFHGSSRMKVYLPINVNLDIPEDCKYAYFGTIVVTLVGDDFTVSNVQLIDEFDEASAELAKRFANSKETPVLYRVDLKD